MATTPSAPSPVSTPRSSGSPGADQPATASGASVYQLRAVIDKISPLIWRRLQVSGDTSIAGLHTTLQTVFGWDDEHLHHFVIHGVEYGVWRDGGHWFRDDARTVRLDQLGLGRMEKFRYRYNYFAGWDVRLRVEQVLIRQPGRAYPRCTGGRRAGPPEEWGGPWDFLDRTRPYRVLEAMRHAAEIIRSLLEADERQDWASVGVSRGELAELAPLLRVEQFDRRALNHTLAGLDVSARGAA